MKDIIIYMINNFDFGTGGIVVQYELAKNLISLGMNVKIISPNYIQNNICNEYYNNTIVDLDNTVVIYGETISGNPLNAKHVIRWILAPLGICSDKNIYHTWNPNDLVYYFNSEKKFVDEPDKTGSIYKLLHILYINPLAQNNNIKERNGYCHTKRKIVFHKNPIYIHPPDSLEFTRSHTQEECIEYFNKCKYFISYDPLTFLTFLAALCGCISIVQKIDGVSKEDWINTTCCSEYFKQSNENTFYGVAYGLEEIEFAEKTLPLVKQQWEDIVKFMINKNLKDFIDDMNNWEKNINTVQKNYIDNNF